MPEKKRVYIRLSGSEYAYLKEIQKQGGHETLGGMLASMIRALIADDRLAEREKVSAQ